MYKRIVSILKLVLLLGIVVGIPLYIISTRPDLISSLKSFDSLRDVAQFLEGYKKESVFIYIGLQMLQVIISVIPGQIFQMSAGYLFGFFPGLILSCIGAFLGSLIAYYLAVFLGYNSLKYFIKAETLDYWSTRLNSKRAYIIVFLLYLIPGLPKDVIAYAAGLSRMNVKAFLLLSMVGRIPAMSASLLIGEFYESQMYMGIWIVAGISILIFIISVLNREKITAYFDKVYTKISN